MSLLSIIYVNDIVDSIKSKISFIYLFLEIKFNLPLTLSLSLSFFLNFTSINQIFVLLKREENSKINIDKF